MANGVYQHGIKHFARGDMKWILDASPTAAEDTLFQTALVDTADYTVNLASHEFRDTGTITAAAQEETSGAMTLIDAAVDGVCDANDVVFTGTAGDPCEGILVFSGQPTPPANDLLVFWWDTAAGLPVTLGGDVTVQWNSSGLATI
jgi:hypothetical protein